jgi:hypothetical protein
VLADFRILWCESMSTLAVCLTALCLVERADKTSCDFWCAPAPHILGVCHWLQMVGVDARGNPAFVI